jgi:hypothetical protein
MNDNDKNLLFDRGSIGEMGLCVEKNKSQYMGVLGYPVARGIGNGGGRSCNIIFCEDALYTIWQDF